MYTTLAAGLLVIGPAARLAMRIVAATSPATSQGLTTEAEEVVGAITADGTFGLIVFGGLFGGVALTVISLLVRRWLPRGIVGGLALGFGAIVVIGPAVDPIRRDNIDFDLVGPGWVSILVFGLSALASGIAVVGWASALSRLIPLPTRRLWTWLPHGILLLAIPAVIPAAAVIITVSAFATFAPLERLRRAWASRATTVTGTVVAVALVVVAVPRFVLAVADIASRGP